MLLAARCGCTKEVPFNDRALHRCKEHGDTFVSPSKLKPRKPMRRVSQKREAQVAKQGMLKRTRRRETAAEQRARLHFNKTVKSWPCWFSWHRPCERCEGAGEVTAPLQAGGVEYGPRFVTCPVCGGDGRHRCTKPKDAHHLVPKDFLRKRFQAALPEPEFVAILFHPRIGAPLCRKAHEAVEAGADRIYFEDLSPECLEYVGTLPDFVLMRLESECPKRNGIESPVKEGAR